MDDAQLVEAALAGDRHAYAAMYDRYADRVHDFCASILRHRDDAADALRDTFLVAFERLDQLADPTRLGPWLYALAHRAILDRIADQVATPGQDISLLLGSGSPDERLSRSELAEFVWHASAGLAERDRALLDLHFRQGLEGRDLAGAAGVAAPQVEQRLARRQEQVGRSLGALVVARTSGRSCAVLSGILGEWSGELTPEFRDRVTAHVDDCEVCNSRRRIAPSAVALLTTPLVASPAFLRGVVLGQAELEALELQGELAAGRLSARAGWRFLRDGFPDLSGGEGRDTSPAAGLAYGATRPAGAISAGAEAVPVVAGAATRPGMGGAAAGMAGGAAGMAGGAAGMAGGAAGAGGPAPGYLPGVAPPGRRPPDRDRRGMLIGGVAGLIVLMAAVIVISSRSKSAPGTVGVGTTSTVSGSRPASDTTATTVSLIVPNSSVTTTTVPVNGHLVVGSKALDLGTTSNGASLIIGNDGQSQLDFTTSASGPGLSVDPAAGSIGSGASQTLMVSLDRTADPAGPFNGLIRITGGGMRATVMVKAVIDPGPMITGTMKPPLISAVSCPAHPTTTAPPTSTITATVSSTVPVAVVVLHWKPSGSDPAGVTPMTGNGSIYTAKLGPFRTKGSTVEWWITAIDTANATSVSNHQTLTVTC